MTFRELKKTLWIPSDNHKKKANITKFIRFVNREYSLEIDSYDELYQWSIGYIAEFWAAMWKFGDVKASRRYYSVVDDLNKFPGAKWFVGARLNFAENLLRYTDNHVALLFKDETQISKTITYADLYDCVARLAKPLRELGIKPLARIAGYMPNRTETVVAMLAATSLGAIWSSCGTELGPRAVVERLGQIEPEVLLTVSGYTYKDKFYDTLPRVKRIAEGIPSIEKTVVIPYSGRKPDTSKLPDSVIYDDFLSQKDSLKIHFEQLPPDHPVYIMFSSGTTGAPKCMVQGGCGVLINHLKELLLHTDLKRDDRICYLTTPSWMMWNWLISSLAIGATIVLYDGNPNYPDWRAMWKLTEQEKITILGCSASYINYLKSIGAKPRDHYDLSSLREISQTGSPLSPEGFEYVYEAIKNDVHFNSISGGTDINGCFAAGTPLQNVYAGELQGPALGMKIKAYDEQGKELLDEEGELVCEYPSPSMPLYFWNDPDGVRYRNAYFSIYRGVWRHGDWIKMHSDTGGITFLGRSDYVLKPTGVRIGPAEIYNVVMKLEGISDSLAVGQEWKDDQRIILFVKLAEGTKMTEELRNKIRGVLRTEASPRHVPALVIQVPDIPYTFSMKKVESAVSNIINGRTVTNRDALTNPESLTFYERIAGKIK